MERDSVRMTPRGGHPRPERAASPQVVRDGSGQAARRRRLPRARLTALGCGVLAVVSMALVAGVDVLLASPPAVYGSLFVLVSVLCALWVRPLDLIAAPISVPIAFTFGLLIVSGGGADSMGAWLLDLLTVLAVNAGWLYGGTLAASLVVLVRKALLLSRAARARRRTRAARLARRQPPSW